MDVRRYKSYVGRFIPFNIIDSIGMSCSGSFIQYIIYLRLGTPQIPVSSFCILIQADNQFFSTYRSYGGSHSLTIQVSFNLDTSSSHPSSWAAIFARLTAVGSSLPFLW